MRTKREVKEILNVFLSNSCHIWMPSIILFLQQRSRQFLWIIPASGTDNASHLYHYYLSSNYAMFVPMFRSSLLLNNSRNYCRFGISCSWDWRNVFDITISTHNSSTRRRTQLLGIVSSWLSSKSLKYALSLSVWETVKVFIKSNLHCVKNFGCFQRG